MFKNMKVSMKLIVSFLSVSVLILIVGLVGIVGMERIESSGSTMYSRITEPMPYLARVQETLQETRVYVREMVIASKSNDMVGVENSFATISNLIPQMENHLNSYAASLYDGEVKRLFEEGRSLYENELTQTVMAIYAACQSQDNAAIAHHMTVCRDLSEIILNNFDECLDIKVEEAVYLQESSLSLYTTLLITIIIVMSLALVFSMGLSKHISSLISNPINFISRFMKKAADTGNVALSAQEKNLHVKYSQSHDEIGELTKDFGNFIERIVEVSDELRVIADGDLTSNIRVLSSSDTMGNSMKEMVANLKRMFADINDTSEQVSNGANQISDGAQMLASGSTQQAATLQQLSASIADVASKTKENAERTANASTLADNIMQSASKGSSQMEQMISAVNEINQANQNISRVIKAIDDIAFQTNILALNAAVEAARAGAAGKGFAVVAEEVRNLAAKSAESAKDTSSLIANSMEKAELGTKIAAETAESLAEIVSGISESNAIIADIAQASEQQTSAIEQINTGVGQVTQVVQQNSATAQQSAAASQEMNGRADILGNLISKFRI